MVLACITTATFTDLVAYSVSVPILPDLATRFNASPTMIGLLFASFGVTLLTLSVPMGMLSDRIGRKGPMMFGLALLAISTLAFAYAETLPMLFAARLVQGATDGMTWIVGFAMIADLYGPEERGRAMGLAMAGSTLGIIIGPVLGGWLYQMGGIRLPFLIVAAMAVIDLIVFAVVAPLRRVLTHRPVAITALVVIAGGGTIAMLEPVIPLVMRTRLGLGPAAIGTLFGIAAVASTTMHPIYGRLSDRYGGRRLMMIGLIGSAFVLPLLNFATDFRSAAFAMVPMWMAFSMITTPSLMYMAEAASKAGFEAYGVRVLGLQHDMGGRPDGCARAGGLRPGTRRTRAPDDRLGLFSPDHESDPGARRKRGREGFSLIAGENPSRPLFDFEHGCTLLRT